MAILNHYTGEGRISNKTFKELARDNGRLQICQLTVPVNIFHPATATKEKEELTLWVELTAFGYPDNPGFNAAERWNETFEKGQAVHVEGNPEPRLFKRADGEPGFALRLENPRIGHCLVSKNVETEEKSNLPF